MSALTEPPLTANRPDGGGSPAGPAGGLAGLLWLTWRQHRWVILSSLLLAAVLAGWMAYLAADITAVHHQCHDLPCPPYSPEHATLFADYGPVQVADYLLLAVRYVPLLIGVFIGVPLLAREHEQRTLLLAWSQDVSPQRWLWTKLAVLGLFVTILTGALSAVSDHLAHVLAAVGSRSMFDDSQFLVSGMLPLAISGCWFAVGVALGAAIRRTLPAMFGVVAGFIGVMLGVQRWYPNIMTPLSLDRRFDHPGDGGVLYNALFIKNIISLGPDRASNLFDSTGHELNYDEMLRICPDLDRDPDSTVACFANNHLQTHVVYQPGSRIPAFHLILASGYLGLGAVALLTVWLIVRRTSLSAG